MIQKVLLLKEKYRKCKIVILSIFLVAFLNYTHAQKIGHLNFDTLLNTMSEMNIANKVANNYLKGLEFELTKMQNEFQSKYKEYSETKLSSSIKKEKLEKLENLQVRITDFQRQAEIDYKETQKVLIKPIIEKAKKAIEAVALELGYRYVFDTSIDRTSLLFGHPSDDILLIVKKKLITMPDAVIPNIKKD